MMKRAIKAINIVLGVLIAGSLALIAREALLLKMRPPEKARAQTLETAPAAALASIPDFESIARSGAFGSGSFLLIERAGGTSAGAGQAPSDIILVGTVSGPSGGSYAVLQRKDAKKQELFAKGEKAFDLGVITAVEEDRVVVNANGRSVTLLMPHEIRREAAGPYAHSNNAQKAASQPPSFPVRNAVTQKSGGEWVIDQRALQSVLGNMGKVLTDARLLPYSDNGKVAGFRLSEVKPAGVFGVIGLKNGDILLKVNDFNIDSPEKGVQLLNGLRGETSVSLDIIRSGAPQKLNYQIR